MSERIMIEQVTRIEGHAKVSIILNDDGGVQDAQVHVTQVRGFEKFVEGRDPSGQPYYWLTGEFVNNDRAPDTDVWALENGYISVVPSMHDLTNYKALEALKQVEALM